MYASRIPLVILSLSPAAVAEPEEGARLFAQLMGVAAGAAVSREDYYSADDGWDLSGLRSDLEIFLKAK